MNVSALPETYRVILNPSRFISSLSRHWQSLVRVASVVSILGTTAFAQGAKTADQQWADVASLAAPAGVAKTANGKKRTNDEIKADIKQQAARSRQAAQSARDFYTQFPGHPKAAEAKKTEALASLRGVETDNATQIQSALSIAQAFRANSSLAAADRFDVALAMDRLKLSLEIKQRRATDQPASWRKLADDLRKEFGDLPALQSYLMDIARTADGATAVELATSVKGSTAASKETKDRAQAILDRAALVGRKVVLKLATTDGSPVDLEQTRSKPAVVVAWSPSEGDALMGLLQYQKQLQNADIIYVGLGGSVADLSAAKQQFVRLPGAYCHAPGGVGSRRAIDALKLQYAPLPRVYVLDRGALVLGSGSFSDLPALLAKAGL